MRNRKVRQIAHLLVYTALLFSFGCGTKGQNSSEALTVPSAPEAVPPQTYRWDPGEFDRTGIVSKLKKKVAAGTPLVAHVLVPLCDNDNQGIVPVNSSLGNGQNPRTNLYWGAGYGIKTHFKRAEDWKFIREEVPAEKHLLDRAIYRKKFSNGAIVYLIADAYDGANMVECLDDFLASLGGSKTGTIAAGKDTLEAWAGADLVAFNGHNGLMDTDIYPPENITGEQKDAVVIACVSHMYFVDYLANTGGYPLVCTTGLMAPEAYVMRAILDAWGELKPAKDVRLAAGAAYHRIQKCGIKGATNLFKTGWK